MATATPPSLHEDHHLHHQQQQPPLTPEPVVIDAGPGNDYEGWSRGQLQQYLNTITGFIGRYGTYSRVKLIERIQAVETGSSTARATPRKRKALSSTEVIEITPDVVVGLVSTSKSPPASNSTPSRKQSSSTSSQERRKRASSSSLQEVIPAIASYTPWENRKTRKPKAPRRLMPLSELMMLSSGGGGAGEDESPGDSTRCCGNVACKAQLGPGELFCGRCSCSICRSFDENKDPALWIECSSPACGLSSHIECALEANAVGVVKQAGRIQLDGSYSCQGCGWISCVLSSWRKLLIAVKGARRTDAFTSGLRLASRLLRGSARFRELDELVAGAVSKLERENGPITSMRSGRGLVTRLSCGAEVQKLVEDAIERSSSSSLSSSPSCMQALEQKLYVARGGALERAYRVEFKDVTSDSMVISWSGGHAVLGEEIASHSIWCRAAATRAFASDPVQVVFGEESRFHLTGLLAGIEYVVRIVPTTRSGVQVGRVEARCKTSSQEQDWDVVAEITRRFQNGDFDQLFSIRDVKKLFKSDPTGGTGAQEEDNAARLTACSAQQQENPPPKVHDSKAVVKPEPIEIRDEGSEPSPALAPAQAEAEQSGETTKEMVAAERQQDVVMNAAPQQQRDELPDLNLASQEEDPAEHHQASGGQAQKGQLEVEVVLERLNLDLNEAVAETFNCTMNEEAGALETSSSGKALDYSDQPTVINTHREAGGDSEEAAKNLEFSIRTIVWLEKEGHLLPRFRLKLLTWLGIYASDEEKKLVYILVRTLMNEPATLAQQLVDTFQEIAASSPEMLARVIKRA